MYNILLRFIYLLSYVNFIYPKRYRDWFVEQKKIFNKLKRNVNPVIWLHCSSVGEYEQLKPLIPGLKKINQQITITFFSKSGYENFKDYDLISQVSYLPIDIKSKMIKFISLVNPMMVIISKNDIWPNMIHCLKRKNIPLYLVGCKLNQNKINNILTRKYYKICLPKFSYIFCQDKLTHDFLVSEKISNNSIIGDTRINQVWIDSKNEFKDKNIHQFINGEITIIYGSVENSDYSKIINTINTQNKIKHIIIPHEPNEKSVNNLLNQISKKCIIYSKLPDENLSNYNILIIDVFGILKKLYAYSNITYVGGGFKKGVHNTLEPAVYGNLIVFGPKHTNFPETISFIKTQIAFCINGQTEFEKKIQHLIKNYKSKEEILHITNAFFEKKEKKIDLVLNYIYQDFNIK